MDQHQAIRFYLNGQLKTLSAISPNQTLLHYLREEAGLTGTKEGCAEGDCGACTVTLASLDDQNQLHYQAINACIRLLPTLDGKALWTVEALAANGELHPVQQAMVEEHASQCGFCTPGFVMSLYSLYQSGETHPSRERVCQALSGNLCRCTGYRPIIDAALRMGQYPAPKRVQPHLVEDLQALQRSQTLYWQQGDLQFWAPVTIDALSELYQTHPDAVLLAGGTDVGLWLTKQLKTLPKIIYLGNVPALQHIRLQDQQIEVGAGVGLEQGFAALVAEYPELAELWQRFASLPIRNSGTLVGNLANGSPIGDAAPILIALGAQVRLRHGQSSRVLALEKLYLDYRVQDRAAGEWLEAVLIPRRQPGQQLACYKLAKRQDQDISAVCAAFSLQLKANVVQQIRIAYGGMAATTRRAVAVEQVLHQHTWDETTVQQAMTMMAEDFQPLSDMRASRDYRLQAAANLLHRFYLESQQTTPLRLSQGSLL